MSRRSSRKIIVGSREFRWKFDPQKDQKHGTISVQMDSSSSSKLVVVLPEWRDPWFNPYDRDENKPAKITPGFIKQAIEASLQLGWEPEGSGAFETIFRGEDEEFERRTKNLT